MSGNVPITPHGKPQSMPEPLSEAARSESVPAERQEVAAAAAGYTSTTLHSLLIQSATPRCLDESEDRQQPLRSPEKLSEGGGFLCDAWHNCHHCSLTCPINNPAAAQLDG